MTATPPPDEIKASRIRGRPSDARATMIAERDAKIAYWLTLMPSAPNEQIAGKAGTTSAAVRRYRQRMGMPNPPELFALRTGIILLWDPHIR